MSFLITSIDKKAELFIDIVFQLEETFPKQLQGGDANAEQKLMLRASEVINITVAERMTCTFEKGKSAHSDQSPSMEISWSNIIDSAQ